MEENGKQELQKEEPVQVRKEERQLPYCTLAASSEHTRGSLEEEPCDDGSTGDYERK